MIKPGMFINERYEIIDKVGSGGMADVYKAKCHRLNRFVAIKILKAEYSTDANFVQKFRAEAQSVAGLSHPNIVGVYDVGEDDGLYYIVMELVEGITLKKYIERKSRLEIKEAVGIAIQISQGMEAAHKHHIVHRDIKPQNIIISREGKVKVADFGIAKAATSNTISQNAIGSVHYLSPEQARGGYSDERSDIYSLGVTLYEMLTGQVPFAGDNSVSVALLHIQSEATPVQVLNPDIPTSIDRIVQKCMQKKPERRYQSASELIRDLKRSVVNPEGDYVNIPSNAEVADSPTRSMSAEELTTIKTAAMSPTVHYEKERKPENRKTQKVHKEEEELDSMNSTAEKIVTVGSILLALAVVGAVLYFLIAFVFPDKSSKPPVDNTNTPTQAVTEEAKQPEHTYIIDTPTPTEPPTPTPEAPLEKKVLIQNVVGAKREDAEQLLLQISPDFKIRYKEDYSDVYERGIVCSQYPVKDLMWDRDGVIELHVSAGPDTVEMKFNVARYPEEDAVNLLNMAEFTVVVEQEYSSDIPAGMAIRTEPAYMEQVHQKGEVKLFVSLGPEMAVVPNLVGMPEKEAKLWIEANKLKLGIRTVDYSDEYAAGIVIQQDIDPNTEILAGTELSYTISKGKYEGATSQTTPSPTVTAVPASTPSVNPVQRPIEVEDDDEPVG